MGAVFAGVRVPGADRGPVVRLPVRQEATVSVFRMSRLRRLSPQHHSWTGLFKIISTFASMNSSSNILIV